MRHTARKRNMTILLRILTMLCMKHTPAKHFHNIA
ncbi:Hypothetical protein PYTT_0439 [Akkermansia glycaniphila]|uniref:Uncharacterized protein n=1 Tax=Akkermansia glycaniphila TaxID=1679444 RepID=A0A1H6KHQ8_9BACT|nr:Hypothetical protein PYTT_0439 [Akkermansia glycaniphila]